MQTDVGEELTSIGRCSRSVRSARDMGRLCTRVRRARRARTARTARGRRVWGQLRSSSTCDLQPPGGARSPARGVSSDRSIILRGHAEARRQKRSKVKSPFAPPPRALTRGTTPSPRGRGPRLSPTAPTCSSSTTAGRASSTPAPASPRSRGPPFRRARGRARRVVAARRRSGPAAKGDRSANVTLGDFPSGAVRHGWRWRSSAPSRTDTRRHGRGDGLRRRRIDAGRARCPTSPGATPSCGASTARAARRRARLPLGDLVRPSPARRRQARRRRRPSLPEAFVVWRFGDGPRWPRRRGVGLDLALAGGRVWVAGDDRWPSPSTRRPPRRPPRRASPEAPRPGAQTWATGARRPRRGPRPREGQVVPAALQGAAASRASKAEDERRSSRRAGAQRAGLAHE